MKPNSRVFQALEPASPRQKTEPLTEAKICHEAVLTGTHVICVLVCVDNLSLEHS